MDKLWYVHTMENYSAANDFNYMNQYDVPQKHDVD